MLDAAGNEIMRHGPARFLGEVNLLSGQAAFVTAVAREPLRYIAVEREALRSLLFDDGPLSRSLLATFIARREALQQVAGLGVEIVGPHSSAATRRLLEFVRGNRLPFTWRDPELADDPDAAALVADLDPSDLPLVRLPGGVEMRAPSPGGAVAGARHWTRALGPRRGRPARSWEPARQGSARRCTAPPRASRRWSSRAAHWADRPANRAGSRTTSAFRPGSPGRS